MGLDLDDARRRLDLEEVSGPVGPPVQLLARLYLEEALTIGRIVERVGVTPYLVSRRLRRAGIRRPATGRPRTKPRVDPAVLEDLYVYVRQGLTIRQILARVGLHQRDVWRQLAAAGTSRRPRGGASAVDRAVLRRLYVEEGHSLPATARILGVSPGTVRHQLAAHGIPLRPGGRRPPSRRLLEHLYLEEGLSPRRIAERLGLTQGQVRYDVIRLGVPRRGCGRPRRAA